jgi:hypothetical protein
MDRATLHVMDAEDRATLVERVALEKVSRVEAENAVVLASAHEDAEGFVRKIAQLEQFEVDAREVSERERREQFEELALLQIRGSELWHAIIGPPRVRLVAHRHIEIARELATLRAAVSSTVESALGSHPMTHFAWKLWASWLLNCRSWRSGAHGLSDLP